MGSQPSTFNPQLLQQHFDTLAETPDAVGKLRKLVLELAMKGRLLKQEAKDGDARRVLAEVEKEKQKLFANGKIRKKPSIQPANGEVPYVTPKNWCWIRLGDLVLKLTDGTHRSPPNGSDGDFKYITAKNIKPGGIDLRDVTYVTKKVHEEIYSRCDPEFGDLLYIKDGATTGVATINNLSEPFSMLSSVALLKVPKAIDARFLLFAMRAPTSYDAMRGDMSGVAITRVTLEKMGRALIPLPPVAEQRRIVAKVEELLALCDELEARQTAACEHRNRLVRSALDHLTSAKDEPDFRRHVEFGLNEFPHLTATPDAIKPFRQTILQVAIHGRLKTQPGEGGFPQVRLDSLGDWALGCGFPTVEQGHTDRPILFSKVSDMNLDGNELEILKTNHTIDEATAKRLRVKVHPPGTVIFPKIGGAIATNKRRIIVKPTAIDNNCLGIVPSKSCSTAWLFLVLSAIDLTKYQSGTSVPALNQGTIGEIEVSLPTLAEQQRIVAKVDELMRWCDALEARLTAAQTSATHLLDATLHQILKPAA